MRHRPEPVLHVIGPTWPTLAEALAAGATVSAANHGASIGVSAAGEGAERRYSLAPMPGRMLVAWARADGADAIFEDTPRAPGSPGSGSLATEA
jgi:hypothetical protein